MSLLHQESGEDIDDAARGESFTKGSSHLVWASLIAVVLVSLIVAFYAWTGQKPPVVSGEIVQVWAHPRHVADLGIRRQRRSDGRRQLRPGAGLRAYQAAKTRPKIRFFFRIFWPMPLWETAFFPSPQETRLNTRRSLSPIRSWPRCTPPLCRRAPRSLQDRSWTEPRSGRSGGPSRSGTRART